MFVLSATLKVAVITEMHVAVNLTPLKLAVVVANNALVAKVTAKDKEKKKVAKLQPSFFIYYSGKHKKHLFSKKSLLLLIFYHKNFCCQGGFEKNFQKLLKN